MNDSEKKEKLVGLLDKDAFDPILKKSPDQYSGSDRKMFADVRRSTESEKNRFHSQYSSAREVKDNFLSDLTSRTAKKKNDELEKLGLPKLPDIKDKFIKLCDELKV